MKSIDMNYCFGKNANIICKEAAGGQFLIDPYRRTLISLNPVALEIWQLLDGERSVAGILAMLKSAFDVEEKELEKDVRSFLQDMVRREMIQ